MNVQWTYMNGRVILNRRDRRCQRKYDANEPLRYINRLKNISRYAGKEAYLDLET